jgi:hypothetical protein
MNKKLTTEQKIQIALSREKSLRDIGAEYGVHHSVIEDIFKESEQLLSEYWTKKSKRVGRPAKQVDVNEEAQLQSEQKEKSFEKELALKQMRIDFLELKLKWAREREQEHQLKINKQLKKKKK